MNSILSIKIHITIEVTLIFSNDYLSEYTIIMITMTNITYYYHLICNIK